MNQAYLVDAHVLLWAADRSDLLSETARAILSQPDNLIFVSAATLWELAIKCNVGKLALPDDFFETVQAYGYQTLPLLPSHLDAYRHLPLHHRDPFDRILIAQARIEGLIVLSADSAFKDYDVRIAW